MLIDALFKKILKKNTTVKNVTPSNFIQRQMAKVNENEVVFAIGDIHGCVDLLNQKLEIINQQIEKITQNSPMTFHLVFLGDYIDRGQASRETLETLLNLDLDDCKVHYLMGNHEQILLNFLDDPKKYLTLWMSIGGAATLTSFGINIDQNAIQIRQQLIKMMGMDMLNFISELESYYVNGDYFFCHAIPKYGKPLHEQPKTTLLYNRFEKTPHYEKIVVHGHVLTDEINYSRSKINIDTGAYATKNLTCLLINDQNQIAL